MSQKDNITVKVVKSYEKAECRICGEQHKVEQLEQHHLLPRRFGKDDSEDNLIQVCANCHKTLEQVYDDDFWERVKNNRRLDADYVDPDNMDFVSNSSDEDDVEVEPVDDVEDDDSEGKWYENSDAPWNQAGDLQ